MPPVATGGVFLGSYDPTAFPAARDYRPQHPTDLGMTVYNPVTAENAEKIRSLMRERECYAR